MIPKRLLFFLLLLFSLLPECLEKSTIDNPAATDALFLDGILDKLAPVFQAWEYELHPCRIDGKSTLCFWIVHPDLTISRDYKEKSDRAASLAQALCYTLLDTEPGLNDHFQSLNPMIVDSNYNTWFIGFISVEKIMHKPVSDSSLFMVNYHYLPQEPFKKRLSPWPDIRKNLGIISLDLPGILHFAAYPLSEFGLSKIQVYLVLDSLDIEQSTLVSLTTPIASSLAKLDNLPDVVEFYYLNPFLLPVHVASCSGGDLRQDIKPDELEKRLSFYKLRVPGIPYP